MRTYSFVLALLLVGTLSVHSATDSETSSSATSVRALARVLNGLEIVQRAPWRGI